MPRSRVLVHREGIFILGIWRAIVKPSKLCLAQTSYHNYLIVIG